MKNRIIIALALSVCAFTFAQKSELKDVEKAIKKGAYPEAKTILSQLEGQVSSMDSETKNDYYFLKAKALLGTGKIGITVMNEVLENLDKVSGTKGAELAKLKTEVKIALTENGNHEFEKKEFSNASKFFEMAYNFSKRDTLYLYNAALSAVSIPDYDKALSIYTQLKKLGYTGIGTVYFATNATSGEVEYMDKETRDLYIKLKTHVEPGERKLTSKKPEIVKNIALIYLSKGENEKALEAFKDARLSNPNDVSLILSEAGVYYKIGNKEEAKKLFQKAIELDPNNPELRYNLGVTATESGHLDEAKIHYLKAVELDPNFAEAYINLASNILAAQKPIIKEMNSLGTTKAENKRYDELQKQRISIYKEALVYMEKALNVYKTTEQTESYNKLKGQMDGIIAAMN